MVYSMYNLVVSVTKTFFSMSFNWAWFDNLSTINIAIDATDY